MGFTFFYRDRHTLEQLVYQMINSFDINYPFKIWDAGCSNGAEPYTFAMILREQIGKEWFSKIKIIATDIDEYSNFEKIIPAGIYPKSDLERMPEEIFKKYFIKYDDFNRYIIIEEIKSKITYIKHNLLSLEPVEKNFDVVICKNVLLHFSNQERIDVLKMYHLVLSKNGLLATEQTQSLPDELTDYFEKIIPNANIYRKIEK